MPQVHVYVPGRYLEIHTGGLIRLYFGVCKHLGYYSCGLDVVTHVSVGTAEEGLAIFFLFGDTVHYVMQMDLDIYQR
jgi:hypothetical protein